MSSSSVDHRRLARPGLLDTRLSLGSLIVALTISCLAAWTCRYAPELWGDLGRVALILSGLIGFAVFVLIASITFIVSCVGSFALVVFACHRVVRCLHPLT